MYQVTNKFTISDLNMLILLERIDHVMLTIKDNLLNDSSRNNNNSLAQWWTTVPTRTLRLLVSLTKGKNTQWCNLITPCVESLFSSACVRTHSMVLSSVERSPISRRIKSHCLGGVGFENSGKRISAMFFNEHPSVPWYSPCFHFSSKIKLMTFSVTNMKQRLVLHYFSVCSMMISFSGASSSRWLEHILHR